MLIWQLFLPDVISRFTCSHSVFRSTASIMMRPAIRKYSLPDTLVLQRLSEFLMDNISNLTSPNKTSQLLTANKTTTNHVTVGRYIKYLCNAFVFYDIKRYDIRGKKYLESSEKFYSKRHKYFLFTFRISLSKIILR